MANGKVNFCRILTLAFRELDVFSSLDHHQVVVGFCFVIFSAPLDFAPACCVFNNQEPTLGYTIPLSQKSRSGSDLFHISNLIENRGWTKVIAKFLCTHSTQINTQFSIKIQDTNGNQFPCPLSYSLPDVQT